MVPSVDVFGMNSVLFGFSSDYFGQACVRIFQFLANGSNKFFLEIDGIATVGDGALAFSSAFMFNFLSFSIGYLFGFLDQFGIDAVELEIISHHNSLSLLKWYQLVHDIACYRNKQTANVIHNHCYWGIGQIMRQNQRLVSSIYAVSSHTQNMHNLSLTLSDNNKLMVDRKDVQAYPETKLSSQLLLHQRQMLQFLYFTNYDIIYETFELKHGSYGDRNRGHIISKFKSQEISKHYQIMSEKIHLRILRDDVDLDKKLSSLEIMWHNRNIPFFHRYYYLKCLYTAYMHAIPAALIRQEELIRNEQHPYYTLFKSINAREACLRNLKKHLADLSPQDVYEYLHIARERLLNQRRKGEREKYRAQGYKLKMVQATQQGQMGKTKMQLFADSFSHLSKLTLYVMELIAKWKQYIGSATHDERKRKERMEYYFYDDNYLLKILSDLGFLKVSFLSQFYTFAPKNDPFMLQPILAFETRQEKTVDHELLKTIFMPAKEHLADIMTKMESLSQEYRYNIRSRKVFDLNVLKKPILRAEEKEFNNEQREEISNLVLKKIESPAITRKAKSVTTFRIHQKGQSSQKKQKIVIQFNKQQSPLRKKLIPLPGSIQKQILQKDQQSPLKNSFILQKNQNSVKEGLVDMNLLNMLKREVIRKVKQDFDLSKKTDNQALELYIDSKVKETMKGIFPFQPEEKIKQDLVFTPITVKQENVGIQIENMFKHSNHEYLDMQFNQSDLVKIIQQAEYAYFIQAKMGEQDIGRAICTLEREAVQFKVLKIIYLHVLDLSEIDVLILQIVEFFWKYENSYEIHFNFFQPSNNEPIRLLIEGLENTLEKECIFARKQLYSTVMQVKLIFKRPHKNVNYIPNRHPFSFCLEICLLFSHKKVMLENRNEHKHLELLNYDYLLMQAVKRFLSSQDILSLKEKVPWKNRLKMIIDMIRQEEESELMSEKIHQIEASNISDLNNLLTKAYHPFLQVSDLVKANKLSLLTYHMTLTPKYPLKSVYGTNHQHFHRYTIKNRQTIQIDENGTQFYFLEAKQTRDYQIVVFSAREYVNHTKDQQFWLSVYLYQRLVKKMHGIRGLEREIAHLWVPTCRYPNKYKERQEMFYHTTRVLDLVSLKADVLLGQKLEWYCNMQMDNSVQFKILDPDIILEPPFGLAVVSVPARTIVYSRVFI